ncbi:protein CASC1 [Selaginella moellendorffii]|uniref:protein CASC1 n=1 Tax=Selaginella moellendorffii TaxID=88036 RepID=UPI000D1C3396|nr:protein CASC1 [Selaginella moellendorffii]|eukprot:XP_024521933.1 protein CASC1 [Selaginella moellendorffii]
MAPKADKKLSKKELKALKKKEKEKLRLEEEERQRIAEEARLAWEAEQARLKAEHDRIVGEWESLEPVLKRRREGLAKHEARYNGAAEWKRYVEPGPLPYAGNDPSMNGYLNVMAEGYDKDINDVMRTLTDIYSIFAGAEELALVEEQKGRPQLVEKYHDYMRRLEELANRRLNHNTAYLLEKSHDYYKRTNECSLFSGQAGWKLALWANHAKNPRARNLDFPAINLFVEVPKPFVFAHVGVRMYHQVTDPLYKSKDIYRTLKQSFLAVTPLTAATIPVEYPFVGVPLGPGNVIPPIIVAYTLPEFVIHFDPVPKVGCWFAVSEYAT